MQGRADQTSPGVWHGIATSRLIKFAPIHAVLIALVTALALWQDWQYDEVWTFNAVKDQSVADLLQYTHFTFANHQVVNSLYFKWLQETGCSHAFFFRLLSLLSFVVFLVANDRLLKILNLHRSLILLIAVAPYLVYFSLGRGYGPALASFSLAMLCLFRKSSNPGSLNGYGFIFFGVFSMLSIFSFLYGYMALLMIYLYRIRKTRRYVHLFVQVMLSITAMAYVYHAGSIVNESDPYIIGTDRLFRNGTLGSVLHWLTHVKGDSGFEGSKLLKIAFLSTACLTLLSAFKWRQKKDSSTSDEAMLLFALCAPLVFMVAAHLLFGAQYPLQRAVMYLVYLGLLLLAVATRHYTRLLHGIPVVLILLFSVFTNSHHFAELLLPSLKTALALTGDAPLLVMSHNPNVQHINQLHKIKAPTQLLQSSNDQQIQEWLGTRSTCYLLLPENAVNKFDLNVVEETNCRDGQVLIKHSRE